MTELHDHQVSSLDGGDCQVCGGHVVVVEFTETVTYRAEIHRSDLAAVYRAYGEAVPADLTGPVTEPVAALIANQRDLEWLEDEDGDVTSRTVTKVTGWASGTTGDSDAGCAP